ncbi:MAG: helix-turn-helix transcriptional regulator [Candidatus Omnitrophota bacterium]
MFNFSNKICLILISFLQSIGLDCLPASYAQNSYFTLRPMASGISQNIETSFILQKASSAGDKNKEPARAEKFRRIIEKHPELDTAEILLEFITRSNRKVLYGISDEKRLGYLRDFLFLGYETIPLPEDVLKRLLDMTSYWHRLEAVRTARKKEIKDLCKEVGIDPNQYRMIENLQKLTHPEKICKLSKALKIDPIFIIKGRSWDDICTGLKDKDKIYLCRLRKGWGTRKFIEELEKAGLKFNTENIKAKEVTVYKWEKIGKRPMLEKQLIIRKVLGESSLFEKAPEYVKAVKAEKSKKDKKIKEEEKNWKYLPGVKRKTKMARFFAENWKAVAGRSLGEIAVLLKESEGSMRHFLLSNSGAKEFYKIAKRGKSDVEAAGMVIDGELIMPDMELGPEILQKEEMLMLDSIEVLEEVQETIEFAASAEDLDLVAPEDIKKAYRVITDARIINALELEAYEDTWLELLIELDNIQKAGLIDIKDIEQIYTKLYMLWRSKELGEKSRSTCLDGIKILGRALPSEPQKSSSAGSTVKYISSERQFPSKEEWQLWHDEMQKVLLDELQMGEKKLVYDEAEKAYIFKDLKTLLSINYTLLKMGTDKCRFSNLRKKYTDAAENMFIEWPEDSYIFHFILYDLGFVAKELWDEYLEHMRLVRRKSALRKEADGTISYPPKWQRQLGDALRSEGLLSLEGKVRDLDSFLQIKTAFFRERKELERMYRSVSYAKNAKGKDDIEVLKDVDIYVFLLDLLGFIDFNTCVGFCREALLREDMGIILNLSDAMHNLYVETGKVSAEEGAMVEDLMHKIYSMVEEPKRLKRLLYENFTMLYNEWRKFLDYGASRDLGEFVSSIDKNIKTIEDIFKQIKDFYGETEVISSYPYLDINRVFKRIKNQFFTFKGLLDSEEIDTEDARSIEVALNGIKDLFDGLSESVYKYKEAETTEKEKKKGKKKRKELMLLPIDAVAESEASVYYMAFYEALDIVKKLRSPEKRKLVTEVEIAAILDELSLLEEDSNIINGLQQMHVFETGYLKEKDSFLDELDYIKEKVESVVAILEAALRGEFPEPFETVTSEMKKVYAAILSSA